jgi:hypothetical protein
VIPPQLEFGSAFADQTRIHPVGLAAVLVLGLATIVVPRRWALAPFLAMACFIPAGQRITPFGLDFTLLRLMVLFGWVRLLLRAETTGIRPHRMDTFVVLWVVLTTLAEIVLWWSFKVFVRRLGITFDALGMYFLFRAYLRDWQDFDRLTLTVALLSLAVAAFFILERSTGHNVFSVFGGVPAMTIIRDGKLRCQGAYSHAILAGCFWVSLLPIVTSRAWRDRRVGLLTVIAILASLGIVLLSNSSTPYTVVPLIVVGAAIYPFRAHLSLVRWALVVTLLALHLVMKAPVWSLLSRIDLTGSSTGWHRYNLIDNAIRRFGEWWLVGTRSTADWGYGLEDVTNQYVLEGIQGGMVGLAMFIVMIVVGFQCIGRSTERVAGSPGRVAITWAFGVSLLAHVAAFVAVSYFGQTLAVWFLTLAGCVNLDRLTACEAASRAEALPASAFALSR